MGKRKLDPYKLGVRTPKLNIHTVLNNLEMHNESKLVGAHYARGNKHAGSVIAQYTHLQADPENKEKQRLLILCYEDYKRSLVKGKFKIEMAAEPMKPPTLPFKVL